MTLRMAFAAALAASAIAAPTAAAADPPPLTIEPTDLPSGTTLLGEGSTSFGKDSREDYRLFKLPHSSGFTQLNAEVILFKRSSDASQLLALTRAAMRDPSAKRKLVKLTARELGVKARNVRVAKPRPLHVGDGGSTYDIRVNRKTAIVVGFFRLDRAIGEIDARGAHGPKGLLTRTRNVLRIAADRLRAGLSPQSLAAPTVTGTAQVGAVLQAAPGTWSDATSVAYAWQRCDASGTCAAIPGATQPAYTVTPADSGSTLEVVVTAANAVGQTSVVSAPTPPVP